MLNRSTGQVLVSGDNGGIIVAGTVNGDVINYGEQQTPVQLYRPKITHPSPDNPAALLHWQSRIPEQLHGRDVEIETLRQWVAGDSPLRIMLMYGDGGVGKTRLAFELADEIAAQPGWLAGQVSTSADLSAIPLGEQGTLLIIDYPEEQSQAVEAFCESLNKMGDPEGVKLRVLLLARREGAQALTESLSNRRDPALLLQPLEQDGWLIFSAAWTKIRELNMHAMPLPLDEPGFEQWQARDATLHQRPLFIIAFALHLNEHPTDHAVQGPAIIKALVKRERQRLKKEIDDLNKRSSEKSQTPLQFEALELLLGLAGVAGKLAPAAVRALQTLNQDEIRIPSPRDLNSLSLWHNGGISALQPDLLAAQWLEEVLNNEFINPGPWLFNCLTYVDGAIPIEDRIGRLGRLRFDYGTLAKRQNGPQQLDPNSGTRQDPVIEALIDHITNDPAACEQLEPSLIRPQLEQPLFPLAVAVSSTLLDHASSAEEKSHHLNILSPLLAETGDRDGALNTSQRAVDIYEKLAAQDPAAYEHHLASSLNNLSNHLAESGERDGALKAIQRAVDIYEELAAHNSAAYAPDLALSLNNLSLRMADNGDRDGALKTIQRAVDIYEKLAAHNRAAYEPRLAGSLNNLSNRLAETGDRDGALKTIQRAVDIGEELVAHNSAAYAPDLARSLGNLSNRLAETGNRDNAIEAIQRAVALIEPFAKPGTQYADWFENMKQQLAELNSGDH